MAGQVFPIGDSGICLMVIAIGLDYICQDRQPPDVRREHTATPPHQPSQHAIAKRNPYGHRTRQR